MAKERGLFDGIVNLYIINPLISAIFFHQVGSGKV